MAFAVIFVYENYTRLFESIYQLSVISIKLEHERDNTIVKPKTWLQQLKLGLNKRDNIRS